MHLLFPPPNAVQQCQPYNRFALFKKAILWPTIALLVTLILIFTFNSLLFATPLKATQQAHAQNNMMTRQRSDVPALSPTTEVTTTIRWFMRWDTTRTQAIAKPLLTDFQSAHPEIPVKLENTTSSSDYYHQLQVQLAQSQPPDVLYLATHVAYELQTQGALLPLDNLLRQDGLTLKGYQSATLDLYRNELGQLYCLPVDRATMAVFYNRALFDAAHVAYPQGPWRWEDFRNVAAALTIDADQDGVPEQYGVDQFYRYWPLLIWSWTGHNIFDDPRMPTAFLLEEEDSVKALQWLADLALQQGVMPPFDDATGNDDNDDHFLTGHAAMRITGAWQAPSYLAAGLAVDVAPLPTGEHNVNRRDGSCLAIADTTHHRQEAWIFLKFLMGSNGIGARMVQEATTQQPAVGALYRQSFFVNPLHQPTPESTGEDTVETFPLYDPLHPMQAAWQPMADKELQALWRGQRDADKTVGRMANAAEDLLEDLPIPTATLLPVKLHERSAQGAKVTALVTASAALSPAALTSTAATVPTLPAALSAMNFAAITATNPFTATVIDFPTADNNANGLALPFALLRLPRHYFVDPTGDDTNSGLHSSVPFGTIQHALAVVRPGDTIHLASGDYYENLTSVSAGRVDAPITMMGPPDAVLRGNGSASAAFYLTHSYYTLTGFTIDGLYGDPSTKDGYTQKLLYVQGTGKKQGVTGLRVLHMNFRNAGGECLRLRYFARQNEIAYSTFHVCGLLDFAFDDGGKNGEGIYIGTASDQWTDGKNPTADPDESAYNWIHHNEMDTQGNECVEVKEGGHDNLIEFNLCTGQRDPDSAGIGARGNHNIIRYNTIYGNVGAGIRLGGHTVADIQYGLNNLVYRNYLLSNTAGGVKIINEPQNKICGNYFTPTAGKSAFGASSEGYDPAAPC